ncbi:MAG: polysaccharide deacetylase family protein [Candidatus Moranbacteria bacterium]|nr:polysaccharide deacetylase family protein [Candidatus Moranbacteria bacterium]
MNTKICARFLVVTLLLQSVLAPVGVFAVPVDPASDQSAAVTTPAVSASVSEQSSSVAALPSQTSTSPVASVPDATGSQQTAAAGTESTLSTAPTPAAAVKPVVEAATIPTSAPQTVPAAASVAATVSVPSPAASTAPVADNTSTQTGSKAAVASAPTIFTAAAATQSTNLILNPSLETASGSLPQYWATDKWGTSTTSFSYPVTGHAGDKAAKVTMSGYRSGDAKWYFNDVAVTPSAQYVFSDWYKSTAKTWIVAQYTSSSGTVQYVDFGSVAASSSWKQYSKTFTVPAGITKLTVLHLIKANGTLTVDDYSLASSSSTPTPAPTLTLSANPTSIATGSSSTLTWSTTDATSCAATGGWTSSTATSGTASVTPTSTTTYSMTCTGAGGTATKTATVTVTTPTPAPTLTLSANPTSIVSGTSSTLTWSATDATSCAAGWTSSTEISGTASVTPSATTTYSMTCTGVGGSVTKTATVTVTTVPVPTENLILNPSLETANGSLPANWAKNNWGTLTPTYAYPVAGHTGSKAAQVTVSGYRSGDAKWFFNDVSVTPGAEYVFSDWYKSTVQTDVTVRYTTSSGVTTYTDFGTVPVASTWTQYTKTFTVPTDVTSLTVFHLIRANGRFIVDDYSLVKSAVVDTSTFSEGMVTFTFDDGFLNTYQNGLPILDAAGIRSTQAIITGSLGESGYVTAAQVQDMASRAHEVASHTRSHADLTSLSAADAQAEIAGSKFDLASIGVVANTIVYPFGTYSDSVLTLVKDAGYTGGRSVDTGYDTPNTNPYALRDQHVTSDVTFDQIKGWIDSAISNKQWLVLELHQQQAGAGEYSNDPALLQQVADYVTSQRVKTVTLGQGVAMMK